MTAEQFNGQVEVSQGKIVTRVDNCASLTQAINGLRCDVEGKKEFVISAKAHIVPHIARCVEFESAKETFCP